jgi:hypothetical protein
MVKVSVLVQLKEDVASSTTTLILVIKVSQNSFVLSATEKRTHKISQQLSVQSTDFALTRSTTRFTAMVATAHMSAGTKTLERSTELQNRFQVQLCAWTNQKREQLLHIQSAMTGQEEQKA